MLDAGDNCVGKRRMSGRTGVLQIAPSGFEIQLQTATVCPWLWRSLWRNHIIASTIWFIAFVIAGHPAQAQNRGPIIIIVPTHQFPFSDLIEAANVKARSLGYEVQIYVDDFEPVKLHELLRDAIARRAAAIICDISTARPAAVTPVLIEAGNAKVSCFLVDQELPQTGIVVAQILPNQYQGAILAAREFVGLMSEKGLYLELKGPNGTPGAEIRSKGYNDILVQYSDLRRVAVESTDWSRSAATQRTLDFLVKEPRLKGVICGNDSLALGAAAAFHQVGRDDAVIVGFGGDPEALQSIKSDGGVKATALFPARQIGEAAVEQVDQFIHSKHTELPEKQMLNFSLEVGNEVLREPELTISPAEVFAGLNSTVKLIQSKSILFQKIDDGTPSTIERLASNIRKVEVSNLAVQMPDPYLASLQGSETLLSRAAGVENVSEREVDIVKTVTADTDVKVANIGAHPSNPYYSLADVQTTRGGKRLGHLNVLYVQCGYEKEEWKDLQKQFTQQSTPTYNLMAVGNWWMWTAVPSDSTKMGEAQKVSLKDDPGKGECSIELPAP
jgi:erythritol transport system substrate-binding protein